MDSQTLWKSFPSAHLYYYLNIPAFGYICANDGGFLHTPGDPLQQPMPCLGLGYFKFTKHSDESFSIYSVSKGKYLQKHPSLSPLVYFAADECGTHDTKFVLVFHPQDEQHGFMVDIHSLAHDSHLTKREGNYLYFEANSRTSPDSKFLIIPVLHKQLALELECEIFTCLKLLIQREFISGLGREIYEMCAPKIRAVLQAKKLFNPKQNGWNHMICAPVQISLDGLTLTAPANRKVFAVHGFPAKFPKRCRVDNFPGTIIYYFEVKQFTVCPVCIGFDNGYTSDHFTFFLLNIQYICSTGCECGWLIYGEYHPFECFEDAIKPEWKWEAREARNVAGCGLLLNSKNQLAIFGTLNGILLDNPLPIEQPMDWFGLYPTALVEPNEILEANFGTDSTKPFMYDIDKCPGLVFE